MDLFKMKFILNETSILTKGGKENSRLGHLDGLKTKVIACRHGSTEILFIPFGRKIIRFAEEIIPLGTNVLCSLFKSVEQMLLASFIAAALSAIDIRNKEFRHKKYIG